MGPDKQHVEEILLELGLAGKTAVVVGASRGIGLAAAYAFLREGARVAICARKQKSLDEARTALAAHGEVFAMQADATDDASLHRFAETVSRKWGNINCWVNNVGATIPRSGDAFTAQELTMTEAVCFHSAVFGCQTAFAHMKDTGGAIVNVSSLAARCGTAGRSTLYGPLKAAVCRLSVMLAAEYAAYGIRVNTVLPGFTQTEAVAKHIKEEELLRRNKDSLLRRTARPSEIAEPIVFLCSDRASYITAASLEISGGTSVVLNPEISYEFLQEGR